MNHKNKKIVRILCLLLILAVSYVILANIFSLPPFTKKTESSVAEETLSQAGNVIEKTSEKTETDGTNKISKTPIQNEGDNPNNLDFITGYVSNKNVDLESKKLIIRVVIDQFLSGGQCELNLVGQSGESYSGSAQVINNPSSSTCEGFDVPLEKLSSGRWTIAISVKSNNKTGQIDGGDVEIE